MKAVISIFPSHPSVVCVERRGRAVCDDDGPRSPQLCSVAPQGKTCHVSSLAGSDGSHLQLITMDCRNINCLVLVFLSWLTEVKYPVGAHVKCNVKCNVMIYFH